MHGIALLAALGATLLAAAGPAFAQAARQTTEGTTGSRPPAAAGTAQQGGAEATSRSPGPPIDRGPHTPEANRAHRGGGAILEGAPGAPAPPPLPTPPSQPAPGTTAPMR